MKKLGYVEPKDYFPKDLRKKYGVGEFNKENQENKEKDKKQKENEELRKVFKGE